MSLGGKTVLITGALGMLGQDLQRALARTDARLVLADIRETTNGAAVIPSDITDPKAVDAMVREAQPDWIVNCAAYTNVDQAESDYANAFAVNAIGPANLARALKKQGGKLLHISTDYVFGGGSAPTPDRQPLSEDAPLAPCGIYGISKRFGDELTMSILPETQYVIVRTSWLHGRNGPNFVRTMLRLGCEQPEIRVVDDQIGSPTWAGWLAVVIVELITRDATGIFNASSRGNISWYDFACEIFRQAGVQIRVNRWTTAELNRPTPRPAFSTLDVTKLEKFLGITCPDWRQDIASHLRDLGQCKEES